ncbi:MAG TPA: hypothetical protein VG476_08480 [Acidimicrobiales bacterium]|nr:hypothetical protein [Acidimicrobiales bacterium]
MSRRWKSRNEQLLELEERAAKYRRAGALIMKAAFEPSLAQAQRDAELIRDMASFDPIRHYGMDNAQGALRSCVLCKATARGKDVDHEADCLWLRAVDAMKDRVPIPSDLPETELLTGPRP